ncbi:MAG TPA: DUF5689 domain-containing protein [Bacteroidia bacterium]|nr:DUF5689 domain-containing protein [Bacteroidia bacterium]
MKISLNKILAYSFVMLVITTLSSCVKKDFDEPPTGGLDPVMTGTYTTIADLKALYTGTPVKITSDIYISGVVIADDQSGNFYKEVVLQDSTGGISVNIDQSNYYTTYKAGRRVFVKCLGLTIGEYAKLIQLGSGVDNTGSLTRIASTLLGKYLLPGSYYHTVSPRTIHLSDITTINLDAYINTYQNTLIKIDTAQFDEQDTTFADGPLKQDRNLTIKDCNERTIIIRSSGYSNFAATEVPTGNGSIIAVLQIYNSFGANELEDLQIKIRDLSDLNMSNQRCGGIGPCTIDTSGTYVNLKVVRCLWSAGFTSGLIGKKIRGTVISDFINGNITANNVIIQDATGGIAVRFTSPNTFALGDSIEVNVSGLLLTEFSGLLEFDGTPPANATFLGINTPAVRIVTVSAINNTTNFELWESTLVKVLNATITGSGTYSGTNTLTDPTDFIDLYTRSSASFAGNSYPAGTVSVTGILAPFNTTKQITIRNTSDVQ